MIHKSETGFLRELCAFSVSSVVDVFSFSRTGEVKRWLRIIPKVF